MSNSKIHPTAIIDSKAEIGNNVFVGPYTIIGPGVVIGDDNIIDNHVTIKGDTRLGRGNTVGAYTSIGLGAQDKAHRNEPTKVIIGEENEIREYISIHSGTFGGTGVTKIGSHNQIMVSAHFGHDTSVGDHCMLANATTLGGHAQIGNYVVTGGLSGLHQFCRIGDYAMLGALSATYQDIPPYTLSSGPRAGAFGINRYGLQKNGFSDDEIAMIQEIFNLFFCKGMVPKKSLEQIENEIPKGEIRERFITFVNESKRGIISKGKS